MLLRHIEDHRYRIGLQDRDDARRIGLANIVAGIELAQANTPVGRCEYPREGEVDLRGLDIRLIDSDGCAQLLDFGLPLIDDLACYGTLRMQAARALQLAFGGL